MVYTLNSDSLDRGQVEVELRRRNRELAALNAVAAAVSQSLDLRAILDAALEHTLAVLNAEGGLIYLLDPIRQTLDPVAHRGLSPAVVQDLMGVKMGVGFSGEAAQLGKPIIVPHLAADARNISPAAVREGWQSLATVPLYAKGKLVGVMTAESRAQAHFTADSLELLTAIGHQVGAAIENARLFQETERLNAFEERLTDCLLNFGADPLENINRLTALCGELLGATCALYNRLDGDMLCSWGRWQTPPGYLAVDSPDGHICYDVIRQGRDDIVVLTDLLTSPYAETDPNVRRYGLQTYLGKAVRFGNRYVGSLCAVFVEPYTPTADDRRLIEIVASAVGVEEQRKQAEDALAQRVRELAALHETVLEVNSQQDLAALLHAIVKRAARLLDAPGGGLYVCDPEQQTVRCVVSYNTPRDYTGVVLKYGEGAAGIVAQTGKPLIIDDYRAPAYEGDRPFSAVLSAPMVWQGQVIGVIHVLHNVETRRFTQADLDLLTLFANQAAVAVENARLLEAERTQRVQAEALRDIAATLTSALSLDDVLDRVLAEVGRVTPHDAAFISLVEDGVTRVARGRGFAERGLAEALATLRMTVADVPDLRVMAETGQPIVVSDTRTYPGWVNFPATQWARSDVGAVLRAKGQLLGFLNLFSAIPGFFTQAHADHLMAFADQAAVAIENARLFEAERTQRAQAEALRDTAAALASALSFDEVLGHILAQADRVVPHDAATIMLVEQGNARVVRSRGFVERGLPDPAPHIYFLLAETPNLNNIVTTGRPEVIADTHHYAAWVDLPETHWIGSHIGVPISSQGRVIGILNLDSATPGFFTAAHSELLQAFADQAAVAVERAQLFETLEERVAARTAALAQREAELRVANTRLADLERLKSQFLANASHELRTPLTNIKAYLDLLERGRPEKRDRYMTVLKREADILHLLVENLLDVAQLDFGRARPKLIAVDLNQLLTALQDICNLLVADRALRFRLDLAPDLPPVLADLRMLRQVITNLVSYATDQSPGGESLVLQTQSQRDGAGVWITLSVTGKWLSVAPAATSGPDATGATRSQTIMPGGGLRLAICQELVTTLGGKITTASLSDDRGSLTVWLPASERGRAGDGEQGSAGAETK